MAKTTPTTIDLGGPSVQREAVAGGAITPGHQVQLNSSGLVVVGPAAGLTGQAAFAVELEEIGNGISDAYASGDQVKYRVFAEGAHVYAWIGAGNLAKGALLQPNGSGQLIASAAAKAVVAKLLEAVDASGGAKRGRVEIVKGQVAA